MNHFSIKLISLLSVLLLLISCTKYDEGTIENEESVETIIAGNASDIERDIPTNNFKIVLIRCWRNCWSWNCGIATEVIDSARTDINGDYSITFDFIKGEDYAFEKQYGTPYYSSVIDYSSIEIGETNIRNYDAWRPAVIKIDLSVTNNTNNFKIRNTIISENENHFLFTPYTNYQNEDFVTTVYINAKPNSETQLKYWYKDEDYNTHAVSEILMIETQDTISLSRSFDCATF